MQAMLSGQDKECVYKSYARGEDVRRWPTCRKLTPSLLAGRQARSVFARPTTLSVITSDYTLLKGRY